MTTELIQTSNVMLDTAIEFTKCEHDMLTVLGAYEGESAGC